MLTRRFWIALVLAAKAAGQAKMAKKTFYITGGFHRSGQRVDECVTAPLKCLGNDRLDALLSSRLVDGITIWTEEEWLDSQKRMGADFRQYCEESGKVAAKQAKEPA